MHGSRGLRPLGIHSAEIRASGPPPKHCSVGECLGSWCQERGHVLIALHSYFDGSYSGKSWREDNFVTLAGYAAEDSIWSDFATDWKRILGDDRVRPKAAYLHMKEAAHLEGIFSWRNGWKLGKAKTLVTDLLLYLQTLDKKRFRQFACSIDLKAYRTLLAEGWRIPDPVDLCNGYCPEGALVWYLGAYPGVIDAAHFFFDASEPFKDPFESLWKQEKQSLSVRPIAEEWQIIKSVTTTEMKDRPALQASDLLAWASNRVLTVPKDSFGADLEPAMKQIIPSSWVVFDGKRFREELAFAYPCWRATVVRK